MGGSVHDVGQYIYTENQDGLKHITSRQYPERTAAMLDTECRYVGAYMHRLGSLAASGAGLTAVGT